MVAMIGRASVQDLPKYDKSLNMWKENDSERSKGYVFEAVGTIKSFNEFSVFCFTSDFVNFYLIYFPVCVGSKRAH